MAGARHCCGWCATPTSFSRAFAPACLTASGVGYETLKAENPRIIYCAITGYGLTGPERLAGRP